MSDLAERDKLRAQAELALSKPAIEDKDEAILEAEGRMTQMVGKMGRPTDKTAELEKFKKIHNARTPPSKMTHTQKKIAAGKGPAAGNLGHAARVRREQFRALLCLCLGILSI